MPAPLRRNAPRWWPRLVVPAATLLATATLAACSLRAPGAAGQGAPPTPSALPAPSGAGSESAPPDSEPIITARGSVQDATLEISALYRTAPDVVTLEAALVADPDGNGFSPYDQFGGGETGDYAYFSGVTLDDLGNGRRYKVLRDTEGVCVCSRTPNNTINPGDRLYLYASFPAPPPTVDTVTISVPQFQPLNDIPIADSP
ncbi:MAG: hypothetical protein H0V19_06075 [Euzebyales bacterium]|nr:hypothetical protein [Euzebyales bacterium]